MENNVYMKRGKGKSDSIYLVDATEVERQRQLRSEALIASLALHDSRPKIASLFDFKRMETEIDGVLEILARSIVLEHPNNWESKFESINWQRVENIFHRDSKSLHEVLREVFNLQFSETKLSQIVSSFRDTRGNFNYNGFLLQFLKNIEKARKAILAKKKGNVLNRFRAKAKMIGFVQIKVLATAKEKALQRALAMLVQALRMKIEYRVDVSPDKFGRGDMTPDDLK